MRLRVQDILECKNIPYRVIGLMDRAISFEDVIKYSIGDINPDEICKTILIKKKKLYYALFLRGKDKIDFKKLKALFGKSSIASLEEVLEVTGIEPGAICPVLLDVPVFVDERVLKLKKLNFGSGDHLYGIEIFSNDLKHILSYKLADFAE